MLKNLSTTTRAAGVVIVSFLCLGGKCTPGTSPQPRTTADISITAGFGSTSGAACSSNTSSGVVTFTITPQNLTGTQGLDTKQTKTGPLPQFATDVERDIESGTPIIGCQASVTFFNQKLGTWTVQISGAAGPGSCTKTVSAGQSNVKIWQGICQ